MTDSIVLIGHHDWFTSTARGHITERDACETPHLFERDGLIVNAPPCVTQPNGGTMSDTATPPLLATRDALAAGLYRAMDWSGCAGSDWDRLPAHARDLWREHADALLASGVVRDPATLADDQALVERLAEDRTPAAPPYGDVRADLRALAAALTEDQS